MQLEFWKDKNWPQKMKVNINNRKLEWLENLAKEQKRDQYDFRQVVYITGFEQILFYNPYYQPWTIFMYFSEALTFSVRMKHSGLPHYSLMLLSYTPCFVIFSAGIDKQHRTVMSSVAKIFIKFTDFLPMFPYISMLYSKFI